MTSFLGSLVDHVDFDKKSLLGESNQEQDAGYREYKHVTVSADEDE
jgi:hypothetical protein